MRALVYYGAKKFAVEEKTIPEIKRDEVLLKIIACGICGTDLRIFSSGHHAITPPRITGHEIVAKIVSNKSQYKTLKKGDDVIVVTPVGCMKCRFCKAGVQNMCVKVALHGHSLGYYADGGFAQYMKVPKEAMTQNVLIKIPKNRHDVALEHLVLCEPLSCVINGQEKLKITRNDIVLILGAGPIGCMHAYVAKSKNAKTIILADLQQKKLKMARNVPADIMVDTTKQNLEKIIMKVSAGRGADVIIVAAPSPEGQTDAVRLAAIRGRISFFGGLPKTNPTITLQSNLVHYKELEIYGAFASNRSQYLQALNMLLNKSVDSSVLVSHIFSLSQIHNALKTLQEGNAIKIIIDPQS
ncbi:alcohol dehydrogenase catalytic domain-containing protein [Candidatus Roizmanbacteria bacterium]|nr:alcohol dehydrogenase catalytic domain-containing protein [Candidatus Roizmanbacteria bacterium]